MRTIDEKLGELAQEERALPGGTAVDDRSCNVMRLEPDHEIGTLELALRKRPRQVAAEVDPAGRAGRHCGGERRSRRDLLRAARADVDREAADPRAHECLCKSAPRLIPGAHEDDAEQGSVKRVVRGTAHHATTVSSPAPRPAVTVPAVSR